MNKILLIVFLGFSVIANAQFFGAGNPVWNYNVASSWGGFSYHEKVTVRSDTIFNGLQCVLLKREGGGDNFIPYRNMLCTDSTKVMFWSVRNNSFQVLYDFEAKQGDSWKLHVEDNNGDNSGFGFDLKVVFKVDSVYKELINGVNLQVQEIVEWDTVNNEAHPYHRFKVYERVGCDQYLFPWDKRGLDADYTFGLRCFEDDSIGFYQFDKRVDCNYAHSVPEELGSANIVVFPNPSTTHFTIDGLSLSSKERTVKIYNSIGQLIQEETIAPYNSQYQIELETTHSAFVVLTVREEGELVFKERVMLR